MAEVSEFQFKPRATYPYPWEKWADGQIWKLTQGTDFSGIPTSFVANARKYAAANKLRVRTRLFDDAVVLQFHKLVIPDQNGELR